MCGLSATAAVSEEGPIGWQSGRDLAEGLTLRCMVFPSGARWELECGK
jgi:hypothetical protein